MTRVIPWLWVCALTIGCEPARHLPEAPADSVRQVSLPDLSRMDPPVQQQLREAYASVESLSRQQGESKTPPTGLGAAYGALGNLLLAAGSLEAAEGCYVNARLLEPREARWSYYLGHVYKGKGDGANSIAAFERALQLQPGELATLVWLGNAYLEQNRPADAEPLFERARSIDGRSAAALFGLGRAALAKRNYAQAADVLERALAVDPRATIVHYPLAMAYRALGQPEKAEAHLQQRGDADVSPDDPWLRHVTELLQGAVALENRGVRALNGGQYSEAAALFRKGIELQPGRASLHHQLGTALAMTGDAPAAFAQFQEAVRIDPAYAQAHFSLGVLLAGNPAAQPQAIAELSAAVRYDPGYIEARVQLANAFRRSGRAQEALSQYERALAADSRRIDAQLGYAMTLVSLKRFGEARDRLQQGLAAQPASPVFAQALARVLSAAPDATVRDGRQAVKLAEALTKDPRAAGSADVAETMAMALAEVGQYDEASRWQRQAVTDAERAGRADLARPMAESLQLYQRHQPSRTPWRD